MSVSLKGILYASVTAFLWGFLAIGLKVALSFLSPVSVACARFSIAFFILLFYFLIFNRRGLSIIIKPPLFLIFAALCLGLNYFGFISGLKYTSPSISQIFIQIGPILLAISGFILFKEKINLRNITGILLVVGGLLVFYYEKLAFFSFKINEYNKGIIWLIIGAIAWAGYAILQKQLVKKYSPATLNLVLFMIPAIILSPSVEYKTIFELKLWHYILLLLLGLNTLVAYGCIALALKYIEANKVSVIITLNPIITLITMAILSNIHVKWINPENFTFLIVIGASMVVIGAILTIISSGKRT